MKYFIEQFSDLVSILLRTGLLLHLGVHSVYSMEKPRLWGN